MPFEVAVMSNAVHRWALRLWGWIPFERVKVALVGLIKPRLMVTVMAVIFDHRERVLLLQHTHDRSHPWGLPSGHVERDESLEEALKREVQEETGFIVEVVRIIAALRERPLPVLRIGHLCRITDGRFRPGAEIIDHRWFHPDSLPVNIRPVQAELIQKAWEVVKSSRESPS